MVERIGKVARVKGVEYDVGRSFDRKEGYEEEASGKEFAGFIRRAKKEAEGEGSRVPEAYRLELGRVTQSLFYEKGIDFRPLRNRLKAYQ